MNLSIILIGSNNCTNTNISNAWSMKPIEVFVVLNKNTSPTVTALAKSEGCKLILENENGKNEGYVSALKEAHGDVLLFLDSSYTVPQLTSFLEPIMKGQADVVFNNLTPSFLQKRVKQWPDSFTLFRQVFNDSLGFNSLFIDSLLTMPHAFTKKVKESVGYNRFENLAIAHMHILEQGWKISRNVSINKNAEEEITPQQSHFSLPLTDIERLKRNQFLEAWAEWQNTHGVRGNYHDGGRRRDIIKDIKENNNLSKYATIYQGSGRTSSKYNGKQLSIIIPAQNEEQTIGAVLHQARQIEPLEIIVVVNGSSDKTEQIARQYGTTVVVFEEALGHDVGRAIGAYVATGDILLFIDADFPVSSEDLEKFCHAITNGVDVGLNDLNIDHFPLYIVNLYKYLLNISCDRKDLGVGSLVAVPHSLSRECVEGIGWETLSNPNVAHVKALLQGFNMSNVHFVDVMLPNRIRPDQHFSKVGHPKAVLRINGDHIESLAYLMNNRNIEESNN